MKTEQEQIEEIVKILLESSKKCLDANCDYCDKQYEKDCAQYRKAVALVQAGYGDVSEYKAEIERLRAEFKELETNAEILASGVMDLNHENYELTEKVKQVQIDVLNKLKKRARTSYVLDDFILGSVVFSKDIDELIKEIENVEIY